MAEAPFEPSRPQARRTARLLALGFQGFLTVDRDWRISFANKVAIELVRASRREMLGHDLWGCVPELKGTEVEAALRAVMSERHPVAFDFRHPDTGRWFDVRAYPRKQGGGLSAYFTDVTQLHRAHEASSARQLRLVIDALPVLIAYLDPGERYQLANRSYERWFGLQPGEVLGHTIREVIGDEAYGEVEPFVRRALAGESQFYERFIAYKHGPARQVEMVYVPDRDEDGTVRGYFSMVTDVSERRRAEAALQESEARFRTMANVTPSVVFTTSREGRMTWASDRWHEYTGVSPEVPPYERVESLVHPEDRERRTAAWKHALESSADYEAELRVLGRDGQYRWFLNRAAPMRDAAGRITGWVGSSIDIHDRKLAEEALRLADRRKDQFIAMLAHELRNPLSAIALATDVLSRSRLEDPRARLAVPAIERQNAQLRRLVDDLLDVARATYGKLRLERRATDLREAARGAAEGRERVEVRGERVWVNADPARLQQMIENLLDNAFKYGATEVRVCAGADAGGAVLSVEDNGRGIAPELLPQLFQPFVQGEQSLERAQGGLGLGLALVQRLAALHDGWIEAASEGLGKGSRFTLHLPRIEGDRPAGERAESADTAARHRVLVIEDEADSRESLRMLLEMDGHEVELAADGVDGLAKLASFRPDVALIDIGLPGMDGYELARRAREQAGTREVKLIAVTGYGQDKDREVAREAGFDRHLTKPVSFAELRRAFAR